MTAQVRFALAWGLLGVVVMWTGSVVGAILAVGLVLLARPSA